MRRALITTAFVGAVFFSGLGAGTESARAESWNHYLDFAYVYTPAEGEALRERLDGYARESGQSLEDFIAESLEPALAAAPSNESRRRQLAVARFLVFWAERDPAQLERAASTIAELQDRLGRHENRYWYHTIRAHQALRFGNAPTFTKEVFDLWFHVIVPLESVYDTHQTLSLERSSRAGFVAALPYLYENMSRLITIRSQDMGLGHDLDALAAVVRFLHDGRVGEHPEVIPSELSAKPYLDRVVERLDGPESDGGSLTFTLALFEASVRHEKARELLGSEGLSAATQEAIRVSIGAYENALRQADTLQGQSAVYNRVLRQIGELYAAKQRLGVSPAIDIPFSIDRRRRALHRSRARPRKGLGAPRLPRPQPKRLSRGDAAALARNPRNQLQRGRLRVLPRDAGGSPSPRTRPQCDQSLRALSAFLRRVRPRCRTAGSRSR